MHSNEQKVGVFVLINYELWLKSVSIFGWGARVCSNIAAYGSIQTIYK